MIEQKIFRVTGFGNLSAIATVINDGKCWVNYYNGVEKVKTLYSDEIESKFVLNVEVDILNWCKENDYTLWSY